MKNGMIALVCVSVFAASLFAAAQGSGERPGPPQPPGIDRPGAAPYGPPGMGQGPPPGMSEGPPGFGRGHLRRFGRRWGRGMGPARLERVLKLTAEQKDKMRELFVDFSNTTRKARMTLRALKDEKMTMVAAGKIDPKKLAEIDDRIIKAQTELLRERLKMKRERMAVLTDDQIRRIGALLAQRQLRASEGGFRGRRGRRGFADWF